MSGESAIDGEQNMTRSENTAVSEQDWEEFWFNLWPVNRPGFARSCRRPPG